MDERGAVGVASDGYEVERVYLALMLRGAELDPVAVTGAFGLEPTISVSREESVDPGEGFWARQFDGTGGPSLSEQLHVLVASLSAPVAVWRELGTRARIRLVCSLYPGDWNQGTAVLSEHLQWLAERGIELGIDIHGWARPRVATRLGG